MTALLWRSSGRHLLRHPWQIGLATLGVALGVAVVVSIDLANASARRAFSLSTETVTGRTTHQIVGGPAGLPETVVRRLAVDARLAGDLPMAPVVEGFGTVPGRPGTGMRVIRILGVDPFAEAPFRPFLNPLPSSRDTAGGAPALAPLLTRPRSGVLSTATARELGAHAGGTFPLRIGGAPRRVELAGVLEPGDESTRRGLADLLLMDVAAAQELLDRPGRLDRIDLIVPQGQEGERLLARVTAALPPEARILRAEARSRSSEEMTRAFRLNLSALSLLALVCGGFLIYNTMTFSVVQRRAQIGLLRALGVTRCEIFALVLAEAAAVAVVGTAAGLGAGILLGRELVRLVTQTINDLYFVLSVRDLALPAWTLAKGAALGCGATLLAAVAPALEATLAPPRAALLRSSLEARLRRGLPRTAALGLALLLLGLAVLGLSTGLVAGFAGLFGIILGCALLVPGATVVLMRLLRPPMGALFGGLGRMSANGVVASLSRTAVALSALVIAVSVTVGIGVMIGSFRSTLVRWLEDSLQDDIYASAPSRGGGFASAGLSPEVVRRAAALPGVVAVHTLRRAEIATRDGPLRLVVLGIDRQRLGGYTLQQGDPEEVWPAFLRGEAVVVSEPFSRRRGVQAGDTLAIPTERGTRSFPVAGVYADFASDYGVILMSEAAWSRFWSDGRLSGFSLALAPGADPDRTIERLRAAAGDEVLFAQSNRALKKISLEIFDRTFRITTVLRLLAGLVAFLGILSALMALQLERTRELGVMRANGATPGQVWQLVTSQTGLMGLAAGLLSLPVGLALAALMIYVINRRSFGWTIRLEIAPEILLQAVLLALAAALLAGVYPAWRMARTSPAVALREE